MNFKPKSVFLEENENRIVIEASVLVESFVGALRFFFFNVDPREKSDVEEAFRKGMAGALTRFVRERGGGFDIFPSEIGCDIVFLNRRGFEERFRGDGFSFLERETERALVGYFEDNEEIGDFVIYSVISA